MDPFKTPGDTPSGTTQMRNTMVVDSMRNSMAADLRT